MKIVEEEEEEKMWWWYQKPMWLITFCCVSAAIRNVTHKDLNHTTTYTEAQNTILFIKLYSVGNYKLVLAKHNISYNSSEGLQTCVTGK